MNRSVWGIFGFFVLTMYGCTTGNGENSSSTDPTNVTTLTPTSSSTETSEGSSSSDSSTSTSSTGVTESSGSDSFTSSSSSDSDSTTTSSISDTTNDSESTSVQTSDESTTSTSGVMPCKEVQSEVAAPPPPNVMLVLDKSRSMYQNEIAEDVTRWQALYEVIDIMLTNTQSKIAYGVQLFPNKYVNEQANPPQAACATSVTPELQVSLNNKNLILSKIPQAEDTVYGATPVVLGVASAINHLKSLDAAIPRAIVLVTDGAANCAQANLEDIEKIFDAYDESIHTFVADAAQNDKIMTYVIGIGIKNEITSNELNGEPNGINPYEKLNQLAVEGGAPRPGDTKFYDSQSQAELEAALVQISEGLQSCELTFTEPPEPDLVELEIGGQIVPKVSDCTSENGWVYVNPEGPYSQVEVCGTWCDALKEEGEANMDYFCIPG